MLMMIQRVRQCRRLKTRIMYFLKRLLNVLFRKVLSVRVLVLSVWTMLIILCPISLFLWMFSFTNKSNTYNNPKQTYEHPVIVWWTYKFSTLPKTIECPNNIICELVRRNDSDHDLVDAYLFYGSHLNFDDIPLPRKWETVIWGLFHEESPRNMIMLLHEKALQLFNYTSTFSRYSDYPFPLQYLQDIKGLTDTKHFLDTPRKNKLLDELATIIFLQSECETATERDEYVASLMELMKVDSYGECLKNKELPDMFKEDYLNNMYNPSLLDFIGRYKFMITIENGVCYDYITEKVWRALMAGTVPIYFGSPTIRDWLPNNNSAILLEDYPTPELLRDHIEKLMKDNELYESYLDHKIKQVITNQRLFEELKERPTQFEPAVTVEKFECLICEKLHQRRNGVKEQRVVNKSHYNCPKPISALTFDINPENFWAVVWEQSRYELDKLYKELGIE